MTHPAKKRIQQANDLTAVTLRAEIERLERSFAAQEYDEWSGRELADLMRGALRKSGVPSS